MSGAQNVFTPKRQRLKSRTPNIRGLIKTQPAFIGLQKNCLVQPKLTLSSEMKEF